MLVQKCRWYVLSCGHVEWKNFEKLCKISTTYHVNISSLWTQIKQVADIHGHTGDQRALQPSKTCRKKPISLDLCLHAVTPSCITKAWSFSTFLVTTKSVTWKVSLMNFDNWEKHFNGIVKAMQISTHMRIRDVGWQCRRDQFCWSQYHYNIHYNVGSPDG